MAGRVSLHSPDDLHIRFHCLCQRAQFFLHRNHDYCVLAEHLPSGGYRAAPDARLDQDHRPPGSIGVCVRYFVCHHRRIFGPVAQAAWNQLSAQGCDVKSLPGVRMKFLGDDACRR